MRKQNLIQYIILPTIFFFLYSCVIAIFPLVQGRKDFSTIEQIDIAITGILIAVIAAYLYVTRDKNVKSD